MFNFLKNSLKNIYTQFNSKLTNLFNRSSIDEDTLNELKTILLQADTGVATTNALIDHLTQKVNAGHLTAGADLQQALANYLTAQLNLPASENSSIFLLVGINGSGKTTFAAKIAHMYAQQDKKVLLVAADTFRTAAQEQLSEWANKLNIDIEIGKPDQDPASVVYVGCQKYLTESYDILIIDTAGRLQTKTYLMQELEKIKRVIAKKIPDQSITTLLTVDAMLGQNSFDQAQLFHDHITLDGIVLTKMDGTGKGGIVFAIAQQLKIPVAFISYGEQPEQIKQFDSAEYIVELLAN